MSLRAYVFGVLSIVANIALVNWVAIAKLDGLLATQSFWISVIAIDAGALLALGMLARPFDVFRYLWRLWRTGALSFDRRYRRACGGSDWGGLAVGLIVTLGIPVLAASCVLNSEWPFGAEDYIVVAAFCAFAVIGVILGGSVTVVQLGVMDDVLRWDEKGDASASPPGRDG